MPARPTYPGVYIEENPNGVRTITGVATSIAAFIGRALRGPVDEATSINSFAEFERLFGGLWVKSTMSYAVRDFFLNGGSQAIIVRVHREATAARITLPTEGSPPSDPLLLDAASPGAWGNKLSASVNHQTNNLHDGAGAPDPNLFNLTIFKDGVEAETYMNVSLNTTDSSYDHCYLPHVLEQRSSLVRVPSGPDQPPVPSDRPLETTVSDSPPGSPPGPQNGPVPADSSSGSDGADITDSELLGSSSEGSGLYALDGADLFNLLCIPPPTRTTDTAATVYQAALKYCVARRAMLIVDPPQAWGTTLSFSEPIKNLSSFGLSGADARNAALYFPRVHEVDPMRDGEIDTFVSCGVVAGVIARTDTHRGVWKAPAGIEASMNGIHGLQVNLSDGENSPLNQVGINCLRSFQTFGPVVWGSRTLRGADQFADDYKYIPARRLALFIEESIYRGTQWVVFEPNDEPLWSQIRLNVGAFMHDLFRSGAFQGESASEAYLVKCDSETTTQSDRELGVVNIEIGFSPLKSAEFVMIRIQQRTDQVEV